MIDGRTGLRAAHLCEAGELYGALEALEPRDRRILGRIIRRLAAIEGSSGEAVALAVGERMMMMLRGRAAT